MTTNDYIQLALAIVAFILWVWAVWSTHRDYLPPTNRSVAIHIAAAICTLAYCLWPTKAQALGAAGVAARGGVHRHCDDACLYRLDQEEARRAAEREKDEARRAAFLARQEAQRREWMGKGIHYGQRPMVKGQSPAYTPPPPKPPKAHAERMGEVNVLRSEK